MKAADDKAKLWHRPSLISDGGRSHECGRGRLVCRDAPDSRARLIYGKINIRRCRRRAGRIVGITIPAAVLVKSVDNAGGRVGCLTSRSWRKNRGPKVKITVCGQERDGQSAIVTGVKFRMYRCQQGRTGSNGDILQTKRFTLCGSVGRSNQGRNPTEIGGRIELTRSCIDKSGIARVIVRIRLPLRVKAYGKINCVRSRAGVHQQCVDGGLSGAGSGNAAVVLGLRVSNGVDSNSR